MVRWECYAQVTGKAAKTQPWWLLCVTKHSVPKLVAFFSFGSSEIRSRSLKEKVLVCRSASVSLEARLRAI